MNATEAVATPPGGRATALEMHGIACGFGTRTVLEGFGLSVRRGECYALLGRNGAGKTTALRIACGLHAPRAGGVRVLGHDMSREPLAAKRPLAWLPDEPVLYDTLTAGEYLEFVGALWSMDAALVRERSLDLLAQLQLADAADRYLGTYSRGMRQRVALAGALLHEPDLIVMDEPFTGLDPLSARHVRRVLAQRLEAGAAVLLSTHLIDMAERLATRIGVLDRGMVRVEGTVAEIRARAPGGIEDAFADIVAEAC